MDGHHAGRALARRLPLGGLERPPGTRAGLARHRHPRRGPARRGSADIVGVLDRGAVDRSCVRCSTRGDRARRFEVRLERLLDRLVGAETAADAPGRVLVPGEPEADAERRADAHGVVLDARHHGALVAIGERLGVPFPSATGGGAG
jgi:hypothetical protein